jgi:hypothetical protein
MLSRRFKLTVLSVGIGLGRRTWKIDECLQYWKLFGYPIEAHKRAIHPETQ